MKIIGLEEHFAISEIMDAWKNVDPRWRDLALKASEMTGSHSLLTRASDGILRRASRSSGWFLLVSSIDFPICKSLEVIGARWCCSISTASTC